MALAAITLTGCGSQQAHSLEMYSMNTLMSMTAYGENAEEALAEVSARINTLERELSVTIPESDISRVNSADGQPVKLCEDAQNIIAESLEISQQTSGALDITIYPVVSAWGFTTGENRVPDEQELSSLLALTDYTRVELSDGFITLPEGFKADLGALTKGYAGDCAAEILHENGISSAILNLGGNVCAIGAKPDGTPWRVAVTDPGDTSAYAGILTAQDEFVVTSGKYERCFTAEDGKTYHHIIDPATGYPSENGVASVTVVGKSGIRCDALSTALLVMGEEKACEFWREYGDFDMLLITDDGRLIASPGLAERFSPENGHSLSVIEG